MSKYSLEFKLKVIHEYYENKSSIQGLADKYDIPANSLIRTWVNQYEQDGVESLDYQTNKSKFTGEFKLHVIQYRQSNRLTYQEVDNLFGISHASTIANWVHVYKREGLVGLSRPIGRSTKMSTQDKVKKYPLKETEREALERLREENEFLRLSIRYQKKLNALVQEKERKKKERQR